MTGHLIHIGYPKTGSNFLRRWFDAHPQLAYAKGGIAGFANVLDVARQAAAPPAGIRFRVTSHEALSIPVLNDSRPGTDGAKRALPLEAAQARTCHTLASLFPRAHILIVTRGFRSIMLSAYSQYVRTGGSQDLEVLAGGDRGEKPWNYDYLIDLYERAFGADRLIVLPYELLRDDAGAFLGELQRRLRVDSFAIPTGLVYPALSAEELRWYPRLTRAVAKLPVGARLRRRLLGLYVRQADRNRFRSLIAFLQFVRPATPVTADLLPEALVETYRGQARRLRDEPLYARYLPDYLL